MYIPGMKAITITIPEDLDNAAAAEASRLGISKSELIRRGLAQVLPAGDGATDEDPWRGLAGFAARGITTRPGDIDDVVYGS